MTALVLDCSVAMAWCFEAETTDYSEAVLDAVVSGSAIAPALWALEVANVLAVSRRRQVLTGARIAKFAELLGRLDVRLEACDRELALGDVLELAHRHGLTSYDAVYLELARRRDVPLATLDESLRAAARADGVALFAG